MASILLSTVQTVLFNNSSFYVPQLAARRRTGMTFVLAIGHGEQNYSLLADLIDLSSEAVGSHRPGAALAKSNTHARVLVQSRVKVADQDARGVKDARGPLAICIGDNAH
ncbi:hypothetical protein T492DRAFT_917256 [Pavlovales sp. CCMP2436]|nr:hypothetical protein T492DRAFT_917256 [Pavlovales sp. CCMP2436]